GLAGSGVLPVLVLVPVLVTALLVDWRGLLVIGAISVILVGGIAALEQSGTLLGGSAPVVVSPIQLALRLLGLTLSLSVLAQLVVQTYRRELTARARATEERAAALARSEQAFRSLADDALVGIFRTTLDGQWHYANPALAQLLEFAAPAELMRQPASSIYQQPQDREALMARLQRGEQLVNHELALRTRTGTERIVLANMALHGEVLTGMMLDITARTQAERIRERYQLLAAHARDIVLFVRPDGRIIEANAAAVAAYGYDRAALCTMHIGDLRDPTTHPQVTTQMAQADQAGIRFETVHRRQDGTTFPVEVSSVGADIGGERLLLSIIRDSSERAQASAEQAHLTAQLAQERALLTAVLQQLPAGVGIAEAPAGQLILGNAQLEGSWRHPSLAVTESSGQQTAHSYHLDGRPYQPAEWPLTRALTSGEVVPRELIAIERGDGTCGMIEVGAAPVRGADGQIAAGVIMAQDVTERERAARGQVFLAEASVLLAASLDYHRTLGSVARLAVPRLADWCLIHLQDPDGVARLVAFEHAAPRHHALRADLERWYTLAPEAPSHIAQAMRSGAPRLVATIREEHLAAAAVDAEHLAALHQMGMRSGIIVPLVVQQAVVGALTLIAAESGRHYDPVDLALAEELAQRAAQAITHARLYAAEQQAHAEAEAAVQLRDEFLAVASHEIQTPLAALLGTTQLMQQRDAREGLLAERERRSLTTLATQGRRLNRLIANLLDVTRLSAGRLALQVGPVDLRVLVSQLIEELRATTTRHPLELHLPEAPLILSGDALRLEQVVANLLQNALKYSPYGGAVQVELAQRAAEAVLTISDQGIGIPAEALPQLFTRYYRAPNTAAAQIAGLGIGLFVVKELVERHGGTVSVTSVEGQGSTFTVTLPLTPSH
ncbi:MAG: PAS domain S-box protein, partial [Chloroflexales bacterium]|nr:PAS domain S-box protein [Chloroflexales bacterium]